MVCYIGTWATYRQGDGQFNLEHLEPSLCTHIVYAFAGLDDKTMGIKSLGKFKFFFAFNFSNVRLSTWPVGVVVSASNCKTEDPIQDKIFVRLYEQKYLLCFWVLNIYININLSKCDHHNTGSA